MRSEQNLNLAFTVSRQINSNVSDAIRYNHITDMGHWYIIISLKFSH